MSAMQVRPVEQDVEQRLLNDRERFVSFAFAAAELLVETTMDGRVTFATGAFRSRFGYEPSRVLGCPASTIVTGEDGPGFATCMTLLAARGRLSPTPIRLANTARSECLFAGLARPGPDGSSLLCLSFMPLPAATRIPAPTLSGGAAFTRETEGRLRLANTSSTAAPVMDLLEVAANGAPLAGDILASALLDQVGAGTIAGELAPGRFGLLHSAASSDVADLVAVIAGLEKALRDRGLDARVTSGERFALDGEAAGEATAMQAVRALRQALSTFARGGTPALRAAGFTGGLGGFVAAASARVEALRRALQERRFHLEFQPIVQLTDRSVHHYEALLRPEPARGVPVQVPADLVNLAERIPAS